MFRTAFALLLAAFCAANLAACARSYHQVDTSGMNSFERLAVDRDAGGLPQRARLRVPLVFAGDNYSSAATSLTMVMNYLDGAEYDRKEVWRRSATTFEMVLKTCGQDFAGLERAARSYGFTRMEFRTSLSLDDLRRSLADNVPVILVVREIGGAKEKSFRCVVVVGYEGEVFALNDPFKGLVEVRGEVLEQHWRGELCSPQPGLVERPAWLLQPK